MRIVPFALSILNVTVSIVRPRVWLVAEGGVEPPTSC